MDFEQLIAIFNSHSTTAKIGSDGDYERINCIRSDDYIFIVNDILKAAELWQQSNLERIKELEEGLDKMIKAFEKPIDVFDRNDVIDKAKQLLK